jgi:hypothetical protein
MVSVDGFICSQSVFSENMAGSLDGVDSNLIRFMVLGSGL